MWFTKRAGHPATKADEEGAVRVVLEDVIPDGVRLPETLGGKSARVVGWFTAPCIDCGRPCKNLKLDCGDGSPLYLAECDKIYWYRSKLVTEPTLQFVQFMHPGKEHRPGTNGSKPWNTTDRSHRRTFVSQSGRFLSTDKMQRPRQGELHFWCEWECEAELDQSFRARDVPEYPRYLFKPSIRARRSFSKVHNTDPNVFGDCFRYCICRQKKIKRLGNLARGSLILFGSHLSGEFVLDTVFVVASGKDYDESDYDELGVSDVYRIASLEPIFGNDKCAGAKAGRLYEGATWENPLDGMFSFFPCLPAAESKKSGGFRRPRIRINDWVNPALMMGVKIHEPESADEVAQIWEKVVKQVQRAGLSLGISAQPPILKPAN